MESIIVALITVAAPLLIPIITARNTLIRADAQDEELQELATSLSMPGIAKRIEERRRRRIMRDAIFRGSRRASLLLMSYGIFLLGLSIYILEEKRRTGGSALMGTWSLWMFIPLSVICILSSYYVLNYPTSAVKKLSHLDSKARDAQEAFDKVQNSLTNQPSSWIVSRLNTADQLFPRYINLKRIAFSLLNTNRRLKRYLLRLPASSPSGGRGSSARFLRAASEHRISPA